MSSATAEFLRPVLILFAAIAPSSACRTLLAAPATQPPAAEQWIDQLASPDTATRDVAEAHLSDAGKSSVELLEPLLNDERPDVRQRAARALRHIRLFELHGVPDTALHAAQSYLHATNYDDRKHLLNVLFQMNPQPNTVLARLVTLEPDEDLRRRMLYQMNIGYRDAVVGMLADDGDIPGVISLLNEAATMWGRGQAADDAMALYLTGKIDDQIAICLAEQVNGDQEERDRAATRLCYLYRVCGKFDEALKFARITHDPSLVFLVLQDRGDWAAAAKEPDDRWRDPIMTAAFKATFQRLSGHPAEAMNTMLPMSAMAPVDNDATYTPSRFFLLNDLPQRGIELLTPEHPAVAFQMHVLRGEISAALDVANQYANHPLDGIELKKECDDLRQSLGELPAPAIKPRSQGDQPWKPWVDAVGDLQDKKYQRAADEFGALWKLDHLHYDRLYLQGYALNAAGQTERGQALMKTAELIPLGDPMRRWTFAGQLEAAGLTEVADKQRELALRGGGDFDELGFSEIYNTNALNAMENHQWHTAADALDRLCLVNLSSQVRWTDSNRLLTMPALAHLMKANEAREHHDLVTAMAELNMYQQYQPCSSDMVLEWTPALDELGEHAKADDIFYTVHEKLADICRKYPRSVAYQNDLAWTSACCGRRLDEALKAAEACVKLKPDDYRVLDTLAEVHFRRGERAIAVELEKRAAKMSDDPYIARQIKRFESGAIPSTTQPGKAPE